MVNLSMTFFFDHVRCPCCPVQKRLVNREHAKMLRSSLICCLLTITRINILPVSGYNLDSALVKVGQLISFNLEAHYKPNTLRPFCEGWESSYNIIYSLAPILHISTRLSPLERSHFFSSTVVYFISDEQSKNCVVNHLQAETANRRWDRIVLIAKTDTAFQDHEVLQYLKEYRLTMGYSLDTDRIWVQPKLYDSERFLTPTIAANLRLSDHTSGTRMGSNIRGRHFRIAGCEFPPWTMKIREDNGKERVWGTHFEIIAFAAKTFNFTFDTNVLDGPNYGELHPNGTWSGMYAMIYYR